MRIAFIGQLLLGLFVVPSMAVAKQVSVSLLPGGSASVTQATLLPEFLKLLLLSNPHLQSSPCDGGLVCASEGPTAAADFPADAHAAAFVEILRNQASMAVAMMGLSCTQYLRVELGFTVSTVRPTEDDCPGVGGGTAWLPNSEIDVEGFVKYKNGLAPEKPCALVRMSLTSNRRGIMFVRCKRSPRKDGSSKLELKLKMTVPNPDRAFIENALTANLGIVLPKELEVPCGSTAKFEFEVDGNTSTVEAPLTLFCPKTG